MRFLRWDQVPRPPPIDRFKESIEATLQSKVSWWPLSQGQQTCQRDSRRVTWKVCILDPYKSVNIDLPKWCGSQLAVDIPNDLFLEYKRICIPISQPPQYLPAAPPYPASYGSSAGVAIAFQTPPVPLQPVPPAYFPQTQNLSYVGGQTATPIQPQTPPPTQPKELYWCIDKAWSEIPKTCLSAIDVTRVHDDKRLFRLLVSEYKRRRGFGRYFSWKRCLGVEFIKVRSRKTVPPLYADEPGRKVLRD